MINLGVFFGGRSVEHEVSVISALQAIRSLDISKYNIIPVYITKTGEMYVGDKVGDISAYKDLKSLLAASKKVIMINDGRNAVLTGYPKKMFGDKPIRIDVAFPVVHGTNVEDGTLQGFFKTLGVPFVGSDVTASAVGMDKYVQKCVLKYNAVPVLDAMRFTLSDYKDIDKTVAKIEEKIGYPVIIKAANLGSSVGISVARNRDMLYASIDDSFRYSRTVIAEHAIDKLREINCAVLGDDTDAIASEIEEPFHSKEILSYADKYESGGKSGNKMSSGMAGVSRKIPADVSPEIREKIRSLAVKSFKTLGCSGVARLDFMIDEENGNIYFNEINTIPGSLSFYLWEPVGIKYPDLLDRMIELALKRTRENNEITFSFDTNILASGNSFGAKGAKGGK